MTAVAEVRVLSDAVVGSDEWVSENERWIVKDELEAGLVNQLVLAYNIAFTARDFMGAAVVNNDSLVTDLRKAEHAVAKLGIAVARRHLCKGVGLSKRRGQLIAFAGHLADAGISRVVPFGGPAADPELDAWIDETNVYFGAPAEELPCTQDHPDLVITCTDCLNNFAPEQLKAHLEAGCPVALIREQAEEAKQLELGDNAEILDSLAGGNEFDSSY